MIGQPGVLSLVKISVWHLIVIQCHTTSSTVGPRSMVAKFHPRPLQMKMHVKCISSLWCVTIVADLTAITGLIMIAADTHRLSKHIANYKRLRLYEFVLVRLLLDSMEMLVYVDLHPDGLPH